MLLVCVLFFLYICDIVSVYLPLFCQLGPFAVETGIMGAGMITILLSDQDLILGLLRLVVGRITGGPQPQGKMVKVLMTGGPQPQGRMVKVLMIGRIINIADQSLLVMLVVP